MTIDQLEEALNIANVKYNRTSQNKEWFSRIFDCEVNGKRFKIIWHYNYSTLILDENITVLFYDVEYNDTFPNKSFNLQFSHSDGELICVIPITESNSWNYISREDSYESNLQCKKISRVH